MHFSGTSKASSMCSDISQQCQNPSTARGTATVLAFPLSLTHRAHRPNAGPILREGGGWRNWREKSLGSFFAEEIHGRQVVTHSRIKREKAGVNLDAKALCSQTNKLGNSSAWQNLGKPSPYSSVDPSWNSGSPSTLSGCVMFIIPTSHSEGQEALWFGGLIASTLTRTGVMPSSLRSALLWAAMCQGFAHLGFLK